MRFVLGQVVLLRRHDSIVTTAMHCPNDTKAIPRDDDRRMQRRSCDRRLQRLIHVGETGWKTSYKLWPLGTPRSSPRSHDCNAIAGTGRTRLVREDLQIGP